MPRIWKRGGLWPAPAPGLALIIVHRQSDHGVSYRSWIRVVNVRTLCRWGGVKVKVRGMSHAIEAHGEAARRSLTEATNLRKATRDVALAWKDSLKTVPRLKLLPASARDLEQAWPYFERPDLHKLSAVDAVSFVLMAQRRIRVAFAFDSHFAAAGFRMVG